MNTLYYFSTAKDDFIIDFSAHIIERVPRRISKDTEHGSIAFNPRIHFPLFSGTVFTLRGLKALSRDELVDDVFSAACIYLSRKRDHKLLRETIDYWFEEMEKV